MKKTVVALFGAGGKMGARLTNNLVGHEAYEMLWVETGNAGIEHLTSLGLSVSLATDALSAAEVVILALPDTALGMVSHVVVPDMKTGSVLMTLDPAAAHAGVLAHRKDVALFVTHPCHPPLWNKESTPEGQADFFGGVAAKQHIVCAIENGSDEQFSQCQELARAMYAPVMRSHRITVEQMAILEPAMAETVVACCATIMKEALDAAISRGVPEQAARDFIMGHINIPLAIVFGEISSPFSDGAKRIIGYGKKRLIQPDWVHLFESESVLEQVRVIVEGREE